ncbi:unnamed protein product [Rotaria socialis]|uniref:Uncharacterized protein n=1 Tax=Rotaria socialis TaxID=392032 RepID=A0A817SB90_9BILA|nr:unnamed protein product [Rotaria socialis]
MSYQLKKEHLTNWNAPKSDWRPANINNKPVINYDRDVYIPENSSSPPIVHGKDLSLTPNNKKLVSPPLSPANLPKKEQHTLRYAYNELPENGISLAVQFNNIKEKLERTTYFEGIGNPPIISNQNSYLPSILPRENLSGSKSTDSYTKFTLSKDWRDSIKSPRIYKADPQTKLYDRYFNNVIEKKLTS